MNLVSLFSLWPKGIQHDDVILFVSDAAPYNMVKAAKSIQAFHSNMIHVTCLAHGLHRVCEKIRTEFPKVDELISNMKKYGTGLVDPRQEGNSPATQV